MFGGVREVLGLAVLVRMLCAVKYLKEELECHNLLFIV